MTNGKLAPRRWLSVTVAFGVLGLICYFLSVPISLIPIEVSRYLFMAIGPFMAIAVFGLGHLLAARSDSVSLRLAVMMLVVAGALYSVMTVVQSANFTIMAARIDGVADEPTQDLLRRIMWGVNNVQAALDVAYDIWVTAGGLFLAVAVWRHPWFGPVFGWAGLVVLSALLFLNLYTFPYVPAESGLFDAGPAVGLWFAALLTQMVRMGRREPSAFWQGRVST